MTHGRIRTHTQKGASPSPASLSAVACRNFSVDAAVMPGDSRQASSASAGWRRNWFGFGEPVYNYGKLKGKPKKIGVTASGTKAKRGTIAADPRLYPMGTHLYVPGYGAGTVEDVGGAIKGRHIDVWFPTHEEARRWGVRKLKVEKR